MKIGSNLAIIIFVMIAIVHTLRLIYGINVTVEDWIVPRWFSLFGVIGPGLIALLLWKERN